MKSLSYLPIALVLGSIYLCPAEEKITYEDHVLPFLENRCLNCHNPDEAKGGLDLASYGAVMAGGSGGEVVVPDDVNGSRLYTLTAHIEEPIMPPRGGKSSDKEIQLIADWIKGGLLETANSKAKKSDKPKMDLSLITSAGKPEGPAAMPEGVIIQPEVITARSTTVPAIAHSPWAPIVAVAGQKQVILYHSEDYDILGILPYPEGFPQSLSFSSSGALIQAGGGRGGKSGGVVAWDVKTGERVFEVGREFDIVLGSDISPDHRRVVMGGPSKVFKIWDTLSGEMVHSVKKHPDWMLTADYSPDGVLLATGGRNGGLYIWEGESGLEFYTLKGHTKAVTNIAWRPDSNILASASEDGQVITWEMNEGKQVKKWAAHSGGALYVDFSPDGRLIASVGRDKTLKLWQADGKALRTINASDDIVMSVAFTHDSKRVITGDYNGTIKMWNVEDGTELTILDANPPTIEKQIEYAQQRITDLNSKLPAMEKQIADAQTKAQAARKKLDEVNKRNGELAAQKKTLEEEVKKSEGGARWHATKKTEYTDLANKSKAAYQKLVTDRSNTHKQEQAALAALKTANANVIARQKTTNDLGQAYQTTAKNAALPAFDDAKLNQEYQSLQKTVPIIFAARQQAEKAAQVAEQQLQAGNQKLAAARNTLNTASAAHQKSQQAKDQADAAVKAAIAKRQASDQAIAETKAEGKEPTAEMAAAQQATVQAQTKAEATANGLKAGFNQTFAELKKQQALLKAAEAPIAGLTQQVQAAQKTRQDKVNAHTAANNRLQALIKQSGSRAQLIAKSKAELPAKKAAMDKAAADEAHHNTLLTQAQAKHKELVAKVTHLKAEEAKAKAKYDQDNGRLASSNKHITDLTAKAKTGKTELAKVTKDLEATTKQKEAQAKAVTSIVASETKAKQGIELAKATLEKSRFMVKRYEAEAINYEAKVESEELDDMTVELDDMMEDESEAQVEFQAAVEARKEAEQTLAVAKQTVATGTKKLEETTASVLERALALIASRAAADLREEVVEAMPIEDSPTDKMPPADPAVAIVDTAEETADIVAIEESASPESAVDEAPSEEVQQLIASVIASKQRLEIDKEINAIHQRLDDLSRSLADSYTVADQTKDTVVKAADVAAKTPAVIAQRTNAEKQKSATAQKMVEARKAQELTIAKQKSLIDQLREKYQKSVPKRQ